MKVLHIIPSLSVVRGGASRAAIDMVAALRAAGIDAELACTNDDGLSVLDVPLGELVEYSGVPVRFFKRFSPPGTNFISNAVREFSYSGSFRVWLKEHIADYDLLHVHALFSYTSSSSMCLARKRHVKYIAHPIGSLEHWSLSQSAWRKKVFLTLVDKQNLQQATYVHFTAESEREQSSAVISKLKPLVIPLGLELPEIIKDSRQQICQGYTLPKESIIVLFLGRLHEKKGLELILHALSSIPHNKVRLLIAGDGDSEYRRMLGVQAERLGLKDSTVFLGHVEGHQKNILMQGVDLFTLTSYSENFGIAALEAMAHGTAVLLSKDVALAAIVDSYDLGETCETNVKSVQKSLSKIIDNVDELELKGHRGRDYVSQHHHWPDLASELMSAYSKAVNS